MVRGMCPLSSQDEHRTRTTEYRMHDISRFTERQWRLTLVSSSHLFQDKEYGQRHANCMSSSMNCSQFWTCRFCLGWCRSRNRWGLGPLGTRRQSCDGASVGRACGRHLDSQMCRAGWLGAGWLGAEVYMFRQRLWSNYSLKSMILASCDSVTKCCLMGHMGDAVQGDTCITNVENLCLWVQRVELCVICSLWFLTLAFDWAKAISQNVMWLSVTSVTS